MPKVRGGEVQPSPRMQLVLDAAQAEATRLQDDYVSTEHLFVALATEAGRSPAAQLLQRHGVTKDALYAALTQVRGSQRVTSPHARIHLRGADPLRPRPHRPGAQGQARPGDRPRRGSAPRDPGAVPADQEQSGADRRAGRRQDRHRRGPGAADRPRRRARRAEEQEDLRPRHRRAGRRREVSRRVRGAAEGRAQGNHRLGRRDRALHRRAAHRGRRRRQRGRDGRLADAEADAGPRRAAHDRRDDARRVPQAHREGRGPRAALPDGAGRRARRGGHDLHPPRPARALRDPPRRPAQGRRAGRGRGAVAPLHFGPVPARQGDRPRRRGRVEAAHGDRLDAGRAGRGAPPHHAARNRARGAAQGNRQALDGTAGPAGRGAGESEGGGDPAADAVEPREGGDPGLARPQGGARTGQARDRGGAAGRRLRQGLGTAVREAARAGAAHHAAGEPPVVGQPVASAC